MIAARPYPARPEVLGESPVVLVKGGVEFDAASRELGVGGVQEQRLHVRREPIACPFVPVQQLEGVGPSAPDLDVAQLVVEPLRERFLGDALLAGFGYGSEKPRLQADVGDPRRLVAQDVIEQLLPLVLLGNNLG